MSRHYAKHLLVMVPGFLFGAALAMAIAPGDVVLWLAAGVVLGLYSHAFLSDGYAGGWPWSIASGSRALTGARKRKGPPRPTASH